MNYDTMKGQTGLPRWSETIFGVLQNIKIGSMGFTLPDGRTFMARGENIGPRGHFTVHNPKLFGRIVRDGEMGFAEAYMDGWWETEDLESL